MYLSEGHWQDSETARQRNEEALTYLHHALHVSLSETVTHHHQVHSQEPNALAADTAKASPFLGIPLAQIYEKIRGTGGCKCMYT